MTKKSNFFILTLIRRWMPVVLWGMPWFARACPRCVDATPYRSGLQLAVAVLLPLPFALGFFLYRFLRRALASEPK